MGYFSNGSEGMDYSARYCERCIHYGPEDGPGCPVWGVHLLWNYGADDEKKAVLDTFIPRTEDRLGNEECRMFAEKDIHHG